MFNVTYMEKKFEEENKEMLFCEMISSFFCLE